VLLSAAPSALPTEAVTPAPQQTDVAESPLRRLALRVLVHGTPHTLHRLVRIAEADVVTVCRFVCGTLRDASAMRSAPVDASSQPSSMPRNRSMHAVPRLPLVALHPFRAGTGASPHGLAECTPHGLGSARPGWAGWLSERGARVRRQWYYSASLEVKPAPPRAAKPVPLLPVRQCTRLSYAALHGCAWSHAQRSLHARGPLR
jgi:hypothetical protein